MHIYTYIYPFAAGIFFCDHKAMVPQKRSMPYFLELGLPRNACVDVFDPSRQEHLRVKNVVHHLLNAAICSRSMLILNTCCVSTCFV